MIKRIITICLVCAGLFLSSSVRSEIISIIPSDAKGIRADFLLDFLDIMKIDMTVIEFDLSSITGISPVSATLDVGIDNFDEGLPDGIIDIFTFKGDGIVTPEERYAGGANPYMSVAVGDIYGLVRFDVTSAVQNSVMLGDQFIGFRLSTKTADRYVLGRSVGLPEPVLTVVVPEPATVLLLGLGGLFLRRKRNNRI